MPSDRASSGPKHSAVGRVTVELRSEQTIDRDRLSEWVSANATPDDEIHITHPETGTPIGVFDGERLRHVSEIDPYGSRFVSHCEECHQTEFVRVDTSLVDDGVILVGECIDCGMPGVTKIDC